MRTFDEVNRDLRIYKNDKEKIKELEEEKQLIWDTLYEGHRNFEI